MVSHCCSHQTINGVSMNCHTRANRSTISQPDAREGTNSTGNFARREFSEETKYINCVMGLLRLHSGTK